ncbi:unnamed protein product [Staurois parvus]|uniref:Secreted protein n=1 Tax=Staurois parvus TaxID=386267 RepID=A0ABN9BYC1_9NEOB|nr:unnamed protein product [Staurois parvus]
MWSFACLYLALGALFHQLTPMLGAPIPPLWTPLMGHYSSNCDQQWGTIFLNDVNIGTLFLPLKPIMGNSAPSLVSVEE